jgi:hypothetical protein
MFNINIFHNAFGRVLAYYVAPALDQEGSAWPIDQKLSQLPTSRPQFSHVDMGTPGQGARSLIIGLEVVRQICLKRALFF